jgi:DMSO/TMAO reductase YedYZ molybdopterin-dependent catalytic subunit
MKLKFILTSAIITILLTTVATTTVTATSTLKVTSLSGETYTFTEEQLKEMPQTTISAALYCYGTLVTSGVWSGVQLYYLLTQTNVNPEVHSIQLFASDGYSVSLPIELAMGPNTIIAYQKDGDPLDGLRLVLPSYNGAAWINQIISINMSSMEARTPTTETDAWLSSNSALNMNQNKQPFATPTSTPNPIQPTNKPTPSNPPSYPTALPANVTETNQNPQQQNTLNQSIDLDFGTVAMIAIILTLGLSIVIIMILSRNRLKVNTHARKN